MSIQTAQRRGLVIRISVICVLTLGLAVGLFIHLTSVPQTCTLSFITNVKTCHSTLSGENASTTIDWTHR